MPSQLADSVVAGRATISAPTQNSTVINQTTQSAIVNWQSFSIGSGSSVQFNQPNAAAITLNRVLGGGLSQINGALTANGQVWIINQNGILFGKGSQVNVSGLLATTSDIADADFAAGNYKFNSASPNAAASIDNAGTIHVGNGGSAVLSASHVGNTGLIQADAGQIVLGGANAFSVDFDGDNLLRYAITTPVSSTPTDASGNQQKALVENSGTLTAAGGRILMTARAASNVADNVVNNTGLISATSASVANGEVVLDAGDGTAQTSGTITATGNASGQTGGNVVLAGNTVNVSDAAVIDASGDSGGGTVSIGGGLHGSGPYAASQSTTIGNAAIHADANRSGNGGTIAIWSGGTTQFSGTATARGGAQTGNGGTVETSGHTLNVTDGAAVDTSAPAGVSGNWLLDPLNLTVVASPNNDPALPGGIIPYNSARFSISSQTIQNSLTTTNVTLQAVDDIFINAAISSSASGRTLAFDAGRSIFVNANVNMTGAGSSIVLSANNPGANRTDTGAASITGTGVLSADNIQLVLPSGGVSGAGSIGTAGSPLLIGAGVVTVQTAGANAYLETGGSATNLTLGTSALGSGALLVQSAGDVTIAAGATISSSASGDAVVLDAAQNFINNSGSSAITVSGGGRFLVYSASPTSDTFGGLNSGNLAVWNTTYPTAVAASGNRYVFAQHPTVSIAATHQSKVYGSTDPALSYTATSSVWGLTTAYTDSAATVLSGSLTRAAGENVGGYAIFQGTLGTSANYTIAFTGSTLSITPAQRECRRLCDLAGHAGRQQQLHDRVQRQHAEHHPGNTEHQRQYRNQGLWPGRSGAELCGNGL